MDQQAYLRNEIQTELKWMLKNKQYYFKPDDLKNDINQMMDMIDAYSQANTYLNPIRALPINEQAISNLYFNYLTYLLGTKWKIDINHDKDEHRDLSLHISTKNFYGSNLPLTIEINTYRYHTSDLAVFAYGIYDQAKQNGIDLNQFIHWCQTFKLDFFDTQVQYSGGANQLETQFFQILNFARFIYDKSYQKESATEFAKHSHIAKAYRKDSDGNVIECIR